MTPYKFPIIFFITLLIVTVFGQVMSRKSNIFKILSNNQWNPMGLTQNLNPSKNDEWMFWMIIISFTILFLGFLYCYMEIQLIKNKPGKKGEKGEQGETGSQGPAGRCDSC
jgi:heme/copper-type cytochrome/quinol oxidase subunit 3